MSEKHPHSKPETRRPDPVPPMPVNLPTSNADHPGTTPLRHGEKDPLDYNLPPEPKNDWNP
ncbi:MAG: hypothetical protein P0Y65_08480 [Candidatus Devosia phytovorans]|uniref:Uncharacterized protein n=1 Tax=Candidatus Devosia phytovorans TaxID=3121372 RepID=A0AAJ5VY27_9HYPH|nr:hypothetical protein [Devosia sp.]WEK06265.1 MAG: hypothetical protein P0Y65_08480 [Devosia sp.]